MTPTSLLTEELRLTPIQKKALKRLGLQTIEDLLFYYPSRYEEFADLSTIADVKEGQKSTLYGKIKKIELEKTWKKKIGLAKAKLYDRTGIINLVWFHQPFIARILKEGENIAVTGKVQRDKNGPYLANPTYEKISSYETGTRKHNMIAIYPETQGITSRWFRFSIQKILKKIDKEKLKDSVPKEILNRYKLPALKNALIYIHAPKQKNDADVARKRFAFEEIFFIQISRLRQKISYNQRPSFKLETGRENMEKFIRQFPFTLTGAQSKSIESILNDFKSDKPMTRLLEGDVGSGKTVVAASAAFAAISNKLQVAYMAPTEVLARQLFDSFIKYFIGFNTKIGLITSSECKKFPSKVRPGNSTHISKSQLLKWVKNGEIPIVIGTHALIQKSVKFKNLAFAIIDEQHRFGTNQRAVLVNKKSETVPHLLSMTATPIPRTLALTIYGDLDLTLLDEMPPGRKQVITEIVPPQNRSEAYKKINEEIKKGRQAYVICPRIDTPDPEKENLLTLNMKAVKEEARRLKKEVFPQYEIGMLYGKMKPKEKEKTMNDFRNNKINILVATSVIEVGVDVPNATIIIIEGAERFGLAQLHQLRGRVLRSTHQPYCLIFTESKTQKALQRLRALGRAKNGFELAEYDLEFRGPGLLTGKKQWGISDVGMEALKNIKMVEAARLEAQNILKDDLELKKQPFIKERLKQKNLNIHFE